MRSLLLWLSLFLLASEPYVDGGHAVAAGLDGVEDYEFSLDIRIKMAGMALTVGLDQTARRTDMVSTRFTSMSKDMQYICDGDSLWQIDLKAQTYFVEPWVGIAIDADSRSELFGKALTPPFTFDSILYFLTQDEEKEYTPVSDGEVTVNDDVHKVEVLEFRDQESSDLSRIYRDPASGRLYREEVEVTDPDGLSAQMDLSVTTFRTNTGLGPENFVFVPSEGMKRVDHPGKMKVRESLEGQAAPDLTLYPLEDQTTSVESSGWKGDVVILDFWATWCAPCIKELAHLEELAEEFGDRLKIFAVTDEKAGIVQRHLRKRPMSIPVLLDPEGEAKKAYRVSSIPALYILDGDGTIREHFVGLQEKATLVEALERVGLKQEESRR